MSTWIFIVILNQVSKEVKKFQIKFSQEFLVNRIESDILEEISVEMHGWISGILTCPISKQISRNLWWKN